LIQQPAADWEHLHEGPELLLLLQQVLQILTAPPQSNPVQSNQHRKKKTIQTTIQEHQKQGNRLQQKKRLYFKNPIGVPSYLACSGDGVGVGLIIGIGDIALAGEKHLSVAISASMAAGWTGVGLSCYQ
jgi:hypothetical protein